MIDLRHHSTTDLINEIMRRHEDALFVASTRLVHIGNQFTVAGLASDAAKRLSQFQVINKEPVHENC